MEASASVTKLCACARWSQNRGLRLSDFYLVRSENWNFLLLGATAYRENTPRKEYHIIHSWNSRNKVSIWGGLRQLVSVNITLKLTRISVQMQDNNLFWSMSSTVPFFLSLPWLLNDHCRMKIHLPSEKAPTEGIFSFFFLCSLSVGSLLVILVVAFAVLICCMRRKLPDGLPKPSICATIKVRKSCKKN